MEEAIRDLLQNPSVFKLGWLVIGLIFVILISKFIQRKLVSRIVDRDKRYKSKKLTTFLAYLFIIILLLFIYADNLGGLTIALGVAGAGIAFALQEVITSFAGWLAILFGGFYKTGDRVQLGGIKGDVMDIGILRTTLMEIGQWVDGDLYNGRIVLVANSFIFKEPVFNYSGDFPFLWDEIKVPVQYGSNYENAKKLFLEITNNVAGNLTDISQEKWIALQKKYLLEEAVTEPIVTILANDNWVEFTIRYVVNYKRRRITKSNLFTKILKELENPAHQIKLASATFHLVDAPELNVRIKKDISL